MERVRDVSTFSEGNKNTMRDIINCGETAMIRLNGVVYVPINCNELCLQIHADIPIMWVAVDSYRTWVSF